MQPNRTLPRSEDVVESFLLMRELPTVGALDREMRDDLQTRIVARLQRPRRSWLKPRAEVVAEGIKESDRVAENGGDDNGDTSGEGEC